MRWDRRCLDVAAARGTFASWLVSGVGCSAEEVPELQVSAPTCLGASFNNATFRHVLLLFPSLCQANLPQLARCPVPRCVGYHCDLPSSTGWIIGSEQLCLSWRANRVVRTVASDIVALTPTRSCIAVHFAFLLGHFLISRAMAYHHVASIGWLLCRLYSSI